MLYSVRSTTQLPTHKCKVRMTTLLKMSRFSLTAAALVQDPLKAQYARVACWMRSLHSVAKAPR